MKILLVDDHVVVREGVRRLVSSAMDAVILEASSGREALPLFRQARPDLVILDLNLEGISGLELIRRFLLENETASILVFSMHTEPIYAARALNMGARGYVSKSAPAGELLKAVRRVSEGFRFVERDIEEELAAAHSSNEDPLQRLTNREVEIMRLLGEGKSLIGVAEGLGISYKTAANSCSRIKEKLMCRRTGDLIRLAGAMRQS
ncbi:MAG: response regulator transcription factor [Hyphomicrobiales bacterium]|nr:response regulator transcription factor [Hyphomicrobiales bacterium]